MKPSAFEFHAPETVQEAVGLLSELGERAKVLAGGQSLVPMLSLRLAYFEHLVDIGRIAELQAVRIDDRSVTIGATTLAATIEHDTALAAKVPLLSRVTPLIGHFQIRNRGTLGGSIAHADPAGEFPAVALALDADIRAVSSAGVRHIPATDFFEGFWTSALKDDELLLDVTFPVWPGRCGFGVHEFAPRFGDFAMAGAVVAVQLDDDDQVERCSIGLIGLGPVPLRASEAEHAALGQPAELSAEDLGQTAVAHLSGIPSDHDVPADYRCRVGAAMVRRAWNDAISEAKRV